jgi:hypothetical protein
MFNNDLKIHFSHIIRMANLLTGKGLKMYLSLLCADYNRDGFTYDELFEDFYINEDVNHDVLNVLLEQFFFQKEDNRYYSLYLKEQKEKESV